MEGLRSRVFFLAKCGNLLNSNLSIDPSVGNALPDNCLMLKYLLERWKLERGPTATLRLRNKVHTSWLGSWRLAPKQLSIDRSVILRLADSVLAQEVPPYPECLCGRVESLKLSIWSGHVQLYKRVKLPKFQHYDTAKSLPAWGRAKIPNVCLNPCICLFLTV